jgi:CRISPR/Cas system CSM-associated protein Csm3 (group 7 of RAMP superfamily)
MNLRARSKTQPRKSERERERERENQCSKWFGSLQESQNMAKAPEKMFLKPFIALRCIRDAKRQHTIPQQYQQRHEKRGKPTTNEMA